VTTTDDENRTIWVSAAEVADVLLASPPYEALIEWVPEVSVEIVKVAGPDMNEYEPIVEPLSKNWTVPDAVDGLTVAVKVTAWPGVDGFTVDVRTTEEVAFTFSVIAAEVDEGRLISPGYCAVKE
jgi:hypothetical protein